MVTQQQVQDALRHLHRGTFVATEIAQRFAVQMPWQHPRDAFTAAVSASFDHSDLEDAAELRDLIFQSDIQTNMSRTVAAGRCNLSLRSFYRKRQIALTVIAEHFNRLFETDPAIELLLRYLNETQASPEHESAIDATFTQFRYEFEACAAAGDIMAMQTVVAKLTAYRDVLSPAESIETQVMQAEILIKTGDLGRAAAVLRSACAAPALYCSRRLLCSVLLQQARIAMGLGNIEQSMRLTFAIVQALASWEPQWAQAQALLGRAAALAGSEWSYAADPCLSARDDLQLQAVQARHTFLAGSFMQAHKDSLRIFAETHSRGLLPVAAYAAATLSICHGALDPIARDSWAVTALKLFASCGSALDIAQDLFQFGTAHRSTDWLTYAKESDLLEIYCCLRIANHSSTLRDFCPFIARLVRTIVKETAGGKTAEAYINDLVDLAWDAARGSGDLASIAKELESLAQLAEFLKILWPASEQPQYTARFKSTAGIVVRAITRELSHRQIRALSHVS